MFAIGHCALGYLTGKACSHFLNVKINLPLLLAFSVLPDIDMILQNFFPLLHRGPTHSLVLLSLIALPFMAVNAKATSPYLIGLLSHSLIGDLFAGGVYLFWPITTELVGFFDLEAIFSVVAWSELILFIISLMIMFKTHDLKLIMQPKNRNAILLIPIGAILAPLLSSGFRYALPQLLIVPSIFYLCLFTFSIIIGLTERITS